MTDQQKISRQDSLDHIRTRIGGCFGDQDKIFAGHPFDETRAKELRKLALENDIKLIEVIEIAAGYLFSKKCYPDHMKEQLNEVAEFFGTKLK